MTLVEQVGVESIMLAIIGGTGLEQIKGFKDAGFKRIATPFSKSRVIIKLYSKNSNTVAFLRRHGKQHNIPPHKINYRANIWALHAIGVKEIIATNAIGGINPEVCPGSFILPDQLIDYSYGRHSTFYDEDLKHVTHVDFSVPFTEELRQTLKSSFHFSNGNSAKRRTLMNNPLNHEKNLLKLAFKSDYFHESFKITEFLIILALAYFWKKIFLLKVSL